MKTSQNRNFVRSLLYCINENDNAALLNFAQSMQYASESNINQILELILISSKIQTIKLIYILSIYLKLNGKRNDVIIKCNPLYDKICVVLTRGLPKTATIALNFLAALIYTKEVNMTSEQRVLIVYAQNMIRISGCLTAMSKHFISGNLRQDIWQSLCRCLSETCYSHQVNQNYCSRLISLCVERSHRREEEIFQLTNSLIINNERNLKLFFDCGGVGTFNRQNFVYEHCLQLLNTVVSSSVGRKHVLDNSKIVYELLVIKRHCGPGLRVTQWLTVIFYKLMLNNEDITRVTHEYEKNYTHEEVSDPQDSDAVSSDNDLTKNIEEEIPNEQRSRSYFHDSRYPLDKIEKQSHLNGDRNKSIRDLKKPISKSAIDNDKEYSFSETTSTNMNDFKSGNGIFKTIIHKSNDSHSRNQSNANYLSVNMISNGNKEPEESYSKFRPKIESTRNKIGISKTNNSRISKRKSPRKNRSKGIVINAKNTSETKITEGKKEVTTVGGGIFNSFNESCTTILQSVRNLFTFRNTSTRIMNDSEGSKTDDKDNCSFNLAEYIKGQQATAIDEHYSYGEQSQYECESCNDTMTLKQKLKDDDEFRNTIEKLKKGINLYGCNFKKIAKTYWPNEEYITPVVLHNFYRKLILK